jgi:hypothetical protein
MSKTNSPAHAWSINAFSASGLMLLIGAAALAQSAPALAQSQDRIKAGLEIWKSSGCADCHGPFADGNPEDGDYPIGANLRTTRLDTASLKATISCGRPGTGMPSFDEGAYKVRACDGRPLGPAPDNLQPTPRTLSLEEIDTLIAYLQARIIGRGKITQEECLSYFENALSSSCDDLK